VICSCFCIANLDLLPKFNLSASFDLSECFQAALALSANIQAGLPGLPGPSSGLPEFGLPLDALIQLSAMAQLSAQVQARLGFDLTTSAGINALAELAASLSARISAMASLNLNMDPWIQLAQMNALALQLSAIFSASLNASASISLNASASVSFSLSLPPLSWGGAGLAALSALAQLDVSLDASFVASLQATASALASAMANISLNVSASLAAGLSAVAQLSVSLGGINSLELGFPAVQLMVEANCSAMISLAAQLGIDLSLGIPSLSLLASMPGLSAALTASLTAQLQAALSVSASLSLALPSLTLPSFNLDLSLSAMVAASLTISLSVALGVDVARCWCEVCDLPSIVAATTTAEPVPEEDPVLEAAMPAPIPSERSVVASKALETVMTAQLRCSMGVTSSQLVVTPVNRTLINDHYAANIMDHIPLTNIQPFGMCACPANPTVIAATAAKGGVPTPMPCIPATSSPWQPGALNVLLNQPRWLDNTSTCRCDWGGVVTIEHPGQHGTFIP
jgi:hypothetical protein